MSFSRRSFLAALGLSTVGATLATTACTGPATPAPTPTSDPTWWVPGEESPHERTWMAWPSSTAIWGPRLLPKIQGDIATLAKELVKHEPVTLCAGDETAASEARAACGSSVTVISSIPVNDCWMRDSGPLFRTDGAGGRDAFGLNFNGWGDKQLSDKDADVAEQVAPAAGVSPFAFASVVGEGGGIEYDGDGTLFATESCWINPNRNPDLTKAQIETELLARFGATKMIWLPGIVGEDITDFHVDSAARYVRPGVVMVQLAPADRTDIYAVTAQEIFDVLSTETDARGRRLQVLTVEGPDSLPRWPTNRWDTFLDSYVNWAATNSTVITTQFGDTTKDAAAKAAISAAFPGKTVIQLNLDQLHGEGGGGAHCVTMQEPLA